MDAPEPGGHRVSNGVPARQAGGSAIRYARDSAGFPQNLIDADSHFNYAVDEMAAEGTLGEFEQVVLLAIMRVGEEAYGVPIRAEIEACTGRDPSPGALYTTLDRLEDKGFVTSRMGDPTPQRGGRARRYFEVTPQAVEAVSRAQRSYRKLMEGLELPGVAYA
jgi:PadR family transcriptional regulator PadR